MEGGVGASGDVGISYARLSDMESGEVSGQAGSQVLSSLPVRPHELTEPRSRCCDYRFTEVQKIAFGDACCTTTLGIVAGLLAAFVFKGKSEERFLSATTCVISLLVGGRQWIAFCRGEDLHRS